jgi:GST-like protein
MNGKRDHSSMSGDADASIAEWKPPAKIEELYDVTEGNTWGAINAPTSGARTQKELPVGDAPLQLYSLNTPNGHKVHIILEEIGLDYDAHTINIKHADQFGSGFTAVNPNGKVPALVDREAGKEPLHIWESGSIALYLCEKYKCFIPSDPRLKTEVMNWVFWQVGGQGPTTGNYGHFM